MSTELERISGESYKRHHFLASLVAGSLSAAMHIGLFIWLASVQFPFFMRAVNAVKQKWDKPLRVLEVTREIPREAPPVAPGRTSGSESETGGEGGGVKAGKGEEGADLGKEAYLWSVAPGQAQTEPPVVPDSKLAGEGTSVAEPTAPPERGTWEPRREILAVEQRKASDTAAVMPRKLLPLVDRYRKAPDIVLPTDREDLLAAAGGAPSAAEGGKGEDDGMWPAQIAHRAAVGPPGIPGLRVGKPRRGDGTDLGNEDKTKVTALTPMEKLLKADVTTYAPLLEPRNLYFRIAIGRIDEGKQPVIPKDIMIVQDSSASITEQRLFFCRVGWLRCLQEIGPADRFNIMRFRDRPQLCFDDWVPSTPENIARAKTFVQGMQSVGETDLYGSIKDLMQVKRTPGRPIVVFMVTDGHPTTGLTRSTDIIGEFSKLNEGALSVFTLGTCQTANSYLLDLLSYCNRGGSAVVTSGRWDIPDVMLTTMQQISRPLMSDMRFRFDSASQSEVYPAQSENLYADRALVLYGRCPRGTKEIAFQAVGQAAEAKCDMVFSLALDKKRESGDKAIRTTWARQKIYHLMGRYARRGDASLISEMEQTARSYRVDFPYQRDL